MRRFALAYLALASVACGLTFAPGDYREPGEGVNPAPPLDGSALADANTNAIDGGDTGPADAGSRRTRIALFAGRRDALAGESAPVTIAETMLTSIAADGTLGPITYDVPPPAANWSRAALIGGQIYLHNASLLARAPFGDRVTGAWSTLTIPGAPPLNGQGLRPWLVDARGLLSGRTQPVQTAEQTGQAWLAPIEDGGISPWKNVTGKTKVVRGNGTLVRAGDHVYLVGGQTAKEFLEPATEAAAHSEVEVAKLDANGEPGDFALTESLPIVNDGGAFAIYEPVALANSTHVFLLGGLTSSNASALTDFACAARIKDTTTGALDRWVALPKLPRNMSSFAAVVTPEWLVVFGGQIPVAGSVGDTSATDVIYRLAIRADGTFGTSWDRAGQLAGGRSFIVGVTY